MISIITSIYKSGEYLEKFLRNVEYFNKKMAEFSVPWELVIIGNNLSSYEKINLDKFTKNNSFVELIEVPLESLYASWNRGVKIAKFDLISFWNVDDLRYPKAVVDGCNFIINNRDVNLIYFPFVYKRFVKILFLKLLVKIKEIIPKKFDKNIFKNEMHIGPFFIFRKDLYNRIGGFDENFKIAGDFDWQVRASKVGGFYLWNDVAGIFNNDGSGLSGRRDKIHKKENEIIYQK